tara:strand:- start:66 stop:362 length:297 start_codon:yes stop_codon:yes gene_type:complete
MGGGRQQLFGGSARLDLAGQVLIGQGRDLIKSAISLEPAKEVISVIAIRQLLLSVFSVTYVELFSQASGVRSVGLVNGLYGRLSQGDGDRRRLGGLKQ